MSIKSSILNLMQPGVHLTADEMAGALDLPVLSVRPRVTELFQDGEFVITRFKENRRGNKMAVMTRVREL